jgi:hypothetical protein
MGLLVVATLGLAGPDPDSSALLPKVLAVVLGLVAASLAARRLAAQTRRRQPQPPPDRPQASAGPVGAPPGRDDPDPAAGGRP